MNIIGGISEERRMWRASSRISRTNFLVVKNRGNRTFPFHHFSSFIALQTSVVCPVLESITVFAGTQLQVTVLAFSCVVTTQCWIISAVGGGCWLRGGGGAAATGVFFAAQPARSRQNTSPAFLMLSVFALLRLLVDGNLGYTPRRGIFHGEEAPCDPRRSAAISTSQRAVGVSVIPVRPEISTVQ